MPDTNCLDAAPWKSRLLAVPACYGRAASNVLRFGCGLLLFTWIAAATASEPQPTTPPNILLVLADDLGWSDTACYEHPWHATPHLDRLAQQGLRFTQAYAPAPICSASRASILTGKTPARLGFEFVTKSQAGKQQLDADTPLAAPAYRLNLPLNETTLAEALAAQGYATAFFGKWHVNAHFGGYLGWSPTHGPQAQGFVTCIEDFGSHPYGWGKQTPPALPQPGVFPTDSMIRHACDFIGQPRSQPFLLMVSLFHGHTPVKTRCQWLIDKYEDLVPADSPNRSQRVAYAAFVELLDHHVGELLEAVDQAGLASNTLVVFTSDNGGHPAYTAGHPLRGSKWNLYEGGIRVPLLVRWPQVVSAGADCHVPAIGYDLLPTLVDVAAGGADHTAPTQRAPASSLDGHSLLPVLRDPTSQAPRELIWHFPYYHPEQGFAQAAPEIGWDDFAVSQTRPHSAIRRGSWKLLRFEEDLRVELYDLNADPGERHPLQAVHPQLANELAEQLEQRLAAVDARRPVRRRP